MELSRLAVSLILISVLSFARAQVDCAAFNISATNALTQDGLIATAFKTARGNFSLPVSVQVHDSNMVCLRSGRTRDTYSGVSVAGAATAAKKWRGLIGASLSEPHTIVVYGTTCIDRPTDRPTDQPTYRPCPSHSRDTDTLHVPTLPSHNATLMSDM